MDACGETGPVTGFAAAPSAITTVAAACLRRRWFALVFALISASVVAQDGRDADARALFAQAKRAYQTDLRESAALSERALAQLSRGSDQPLERQIRAHWCMSLGGFAADRALVMADAGLDLADREKDTLSQARFLTCKAYALEVSGDMASAGVVYERALPAAQVSGDREAIANAYAYRGENRHYQGRYDDALIDLNRAFALYTRLGDNGGRRYALNAMANLYSDPHVGEFDKAIEYYRELLKADRAAGAKGAVATALFNIASAYEEKEDYEAALREFGSALELDRELGDQEAIAEEERAIGRVLIAQGNAQEALPMIDRSLAYFAEKGNADAQARTRITRAAALRSLGRLDDALRTINLSFAHFEQGENLRYLVFVHEERADIFEARGEWRAAYREAEALREIEKRMEKGLMKERTSRLRVQFDAARKDEQNTALQAENQRRTLEFDGVQRMRNLQRMVILLGAALCVLLGAMALQQLRRNRRMRALAMTDDLTGLPNRRHILKYLEGHRASALQSHRPLALLAFDVDHFKRFNDQHGHGGGDRLLTALSKIIVRYLRPGDRIGRIGGEEFLVVLPATSLQDAEAIAERLRATIETARLDDLPDAVHVTASFGVAELRAEDAGVEPLLKRADDALYRAKHAGRNRVVVG
jgi:diguanylate cyclase (GGDEF)-like protein